MRSGDGRQREDCDGCHVRRTRQRAMSSTVVGCRRQDLMEPNALARLKRVAGKQTTTLIHYGRKTGQPHEVTIWFVLDGDKLYIGTANVSHQWVRNVQKTLKLSPPMDSLIFGVFWTLRTHWWLTFRRRRRSSCPSAARAS